jgi:hypothetical protein
MSRSEAKYQSLRLSLPMHSRRPTLPKIVREELKLLLQSRNVSGPVGLAVLWLKTPDA